MEWNCQKDKSTVAPLTQPRVRRKATVFKYGQMEVDMKASGTQTRLRVMDDSSWLMAMSTKVSGRKTKLTEKVTTFTQKAPLTKEVGSRTNKKVLAEKSGLMAATIKDPINAGRSTETGFSSGLMAPNIQENGETTKCMEKESSSGVMAEFT